MKTFNLKPLMAAIVLAALLSACVSTPQSMSELDRAEAAVAALVADSEVRRYAQAEVREAENLLAHTQRRWSDGASRPDMLHLIQLTETQVDIARQTADFNRLEARVGELAVERDALRLQARAARAERDAALSEAERARAEAERLAEEARRARAEELARAADQERREAAEMSALAQQAAEEERRQRLVAEERARELEEEARQMREQAARLQEQIAELEARPTDRGLVLTLGGDVLFDFDRHELRDGAMRTIDRIADFLNEYEDRKVLVEGFTDSTGARDYNMGLSERRAESVRTALIERDVDADRIRIRGFGPDFPVASNDNEAGRQLNRRVEIIISDDDAEVPERTE